MNRISKLIAGAACVACSAAERGPAEFTVASVDTVATDSSLTPSPIFAVRHATGDTLLVVFALHRDQVGIVAGHRAMEMLEVPDKTLLVSNMGLVGDTLWIADEAGRRVLLCRLVERSWSERIVPTILEGSPSAVLGVLHGGIPISVAATGESAINVAEIALVRSDSGSGAIVDSLQMIHGELRLSDPGRSGEVRLLQPWAFRDFAVVERDGDFVSIIRQAPATRSGAKIRLIEYRVGLAASTTREWEEQTSNIDRDLLRSWADRVMTDSIKAFFGGREQALEKLTTAVFQPLQMPVIRRIVSAGSSILMVERADSRLSAHAWELWNNDGSIRGRFHLPDNQELHDAVGNQLYIVEHGADRADRVIVATLVPAGN